jgi:hypothetical protein
MDNILTPVSYIEQMQGSLFLWKTSGLLSHAMKEWEVANFQINYLAPFKHKHKHQKLAHEN